MRHLPLLLAFAVLTGPVPASAQDDGLKIWDKIHEVLSHPRCANCHVGEDNIPRWSGPNYGKPRVHGMNISAGASRSGAETLPCSNCHTEHNSKEPHGPPGAHVWALPPVEMQWWGKSSAELCGQIKNPDRNGGRTIAEVAGHIDRDALVHWGWAPGPGREPAPYSKTELAALFKSWDALGAPCPDGRAPG